MHLIVPFAAPLGEGARPARERLALPQLRAWLPRLAEGGRDAGDEWSLSPPHERALARALGLAGADGGLPWAARSAAADGLDPGTLAWGLLTPAHWHLGTDQVSLGDPEALGLDEAGSRELFEAVRTLFTSEGFVACWGAPLRWYVAHESLATLRCASPDRVIGRNVDRWLTEDPAVRLVRRLQNEVQMLLHEHPINQRRQAQGLPAVNSFWLSGCGAAQPARAETPRIDTRLRKPALGADWAGWVASWESLDAGPIAELRAAAERGAAVRLTLCGERSALDLEPAAPTWRRFLPPRLQGRGAPASLLDSL
ncbi:MAG: hypothetical protein KGM91_19680 [Burkholderiales bacterium]|nr:hypothetical protein [Burkholderiales bacterium]